MTEAITENLVSHQQEVERIRTNPDLSDGAKRRMIEEATERAAEESARLRAEERETLEQAVASAKSRVFSISYPERASASEKAVIAMSYRDAFDRAERAASDPENTDALADLLERAEWAGDTLQAEAVYHVATLRGRESVAGAYRAKNPKAQQRWESYVQAENEARGLDTLIHRGLAHSVARRELGG